jgi:hypothetical protein
MDVFNIKGGYISRSYWTHEEILDEKKILGNLVGKKSSGKLS